MILPLHLKKKAELSDSDETNINAIFKKEEFPKGYVLFSQGEVCKYIYYIEKGLARSFYFLQSGKENTAWFSAEESFITAIDTFYTYKPTNVTCELLEDTVVYSLSYAEMDEMLNKNKDLARFAFHTVLEITQKKSQYLFNLKFQTARERYLALLKEHPSIFQRVQLNHIASFLGITPETLSRLRAEK